MDMVFSETITFLSEAQTNITFFTCCVSKTTFAQHETFSLCELYWHVSNSVITNIIRQSTAYYSWRIDFPRILTYVAWPTSLSHWHISQESTKLLQQLEIFGVSNDPS